MPDSKFSKHSSDETPWSDALVDSLLRETAESGAADETFLASVEKAIDAESDSTEKIVPMPRSNTRRPWVWSSGIAAVLVAGVAAVLSFVHLREESSQFAHSIVVEPTPSSDNLRIVEFSEATNSSLIPPTSSVSTDPNFVETGMGKEAKKQPFSRNLRDAANEPREYDYRDEDALGIVSVPSGETSERNRLNYNNATTGDIRADRVSEIPSDRKPQIPQIESSASNAEGSKTGRKIHIGGALAGSDNVQAGEGEHSGSRAPENEGIIDSLNGTVAIGSGGDIQAANAAGSQITIQAGGEIDFDAASTSRAVALATSTAASPATDDSLALQQAPPGADSLDTKLSSLDLAESKGQAPAASIDGEDPNRNRRFAEIGHGGASMALGGSTATDGLLGESEEIVQFTDFTTEVELSVSEGTIVTGFGLQPVRPVVQATRPAYGALVDNPWFSPLDEPLSTFSIDVDTASWTNLRAMIRSGRSADAIPNDAVRIEELINYFDWEYPQPDGEHPFAFATETAECPWNEDHRLMRVGIQGREIPRTDRPDANLVFLLDVSGSMNKPEKLPLVKRAISVLVEELEERDTVSIVVYAGAEGLALRPTSGRDQVTIQDALDKLGAGGSTNGGAGIKLAYKMAREQFKGGGINRVILCTDGDFNVGTTGTEELVSLVEEEAESGVFLSVCGFGQDNLNDAMLEEITNKGNGNYSYIDDFREARKVFLQDLMGTLVTIAKDVKIQIEFNPGQVDGYRLIGYANRKLEAEDFENDEIDAGEVGSGHAVTALYEIVPAGAKDNPANDEIALRYQKKDRPTPKRKLIPSGELALLKLRYKKPDGEQSILMEQPVIPSGKKWERASDDFRFASAVGLFGMILREHESVGNATFEDVIEIANKAKGADPQGWRAEFVDLVRQLADR